MSVYKGLIFFGGNFTRNLEIIFGGILYRYLDSGLQCMEGVAPAPATPCLAAGHTPCDPHASTPLPLPSTQGHALAPHSGVA